VPNLRNCEHTITISAPASTVWQEMTDWTTWSSWDKGQDSIQFSGPLALEAIGQLKLKDGPKVSLRVTSFDPGRAYVSEFNLLGTPFVFHHNIDKLSDDCSNVSFAIDATGWSAPILGSIAKSQVAKELPHWMENFQKLVEA
jgi:hypothetical protein